MLKGLLTDPYVWEIGSVSITGQIWFYPAPCLLTDPSCNNRRTEAISAVAGQPYLQDKNAVSAMLPFEGVSLTDYEAEELHSDAEYKPVLDELEVRLDNSAVGKQKELIEVSARALTEMAAVGMQGVPDYQGLRVQPAMSISHGGGVFITLEARNAELTHDYDEPVLRLIDAQAQRLRAYTDRLEDLSTQPAEVTVRRNSSVDIEMTLGGNCSVNDYDDEFNRAVKALFERC